ncbi:ATP/GTP-binding protein [Streptomyces sp. NBC_01619]|uniref:GTP-binding protein n=1 Tax=Streptomyces sp. NBC_01619 TaxID=2975901 RepID=UPI00224FA267|nr:ATP/GTP-binding protein [Streptomyces sp. NBC_01619]MCX4515818.1 ATP/GTP-binding protein [Streptomyces sp. NBC_01619]
MPGSETAPEAVKILISGGFGVGKTTTVASVSEIVPLRTEEVLTSASMTSDDLSGIEQKTTTTVALDFGRVTLTPDLVLYLFGTPGQQRFWFMWNDLAIGALGGVVLVDTRRLETSFAAIDFFERRGIPFIVAVNCFSGLQPYPAEDIRTALALSPDIQLRMIDARDRASCRDALLALVDQLIVNLTVQSKHALA